MSNENNKMQVDIENLFKQNVNDLSAIKELYRKLKEVEEKILQIKYIDSTLANKLKKEYEKLKKIILDENAQAKLNNDIETINVKLNNIIEKVNVKLVNDIETINLQLDVKANNSKVNDLQGQINNLVLGAVGDGNNAEVIQARGNYTLLNDRLNVIESGYKKIDFGYIDLSNSDFVSSVKNRIATNGIPITEKGIITVNYVPRQAYVYIQHLRYNAKNKKFKIIESKEVQCQQDVINTTVCNFNIDTSGKDYIAIEGIGFTTKDTSIGYMFLQGNNYAEDTSITEYNTPLEKVYGASFGYYITVNQVDTDIINNNLSTLNGKVEECENNLKILKYDNEKEQPINMINGGFWNHETGYIQENSDWTSFYHNISPIVVNPNDVYRIINIGGSGNLHPVLFANSNDVDRNNYPYIKEMYPNSNSMPLTLYDEIFIKIPKGIDLMYINSHTQSGNSIDDLHVYKILDARYEYVKGQDIVEMKGTIKELSNDNRVNDNRVNDLQFELNNLKNRCTKYDNFEFTWRHMEKSYFAITIDDSNEYLAGFYDIAHSKNVPISSACVHTRLNNKEKNGSRTIRDVNNLIIADGGEILAHYSGSPNENTSYNEWLTYTRDVKKALTEEGWSIRGIIRADSTQANSNKGELMCKQYFDYSDSMGTSKQYKLGLRKFLIGINTIDEFKSWVDTCCQSTGFYVICVHGGRTDEPLATNENMAKIIDYIKSKSNTEFTTYSNMFDKFGCTTVEKKIESL